MFTVSLLAINQLDTFSRTEFKISCNIEISIWEKDIGVISKWYKLK